MESLYLTAVSFQIVRTSSSTISQVCRMGQEERRSVGYYQGGLTFFLLERHQVWVSPPSSIMVHQGRCLGLLWTVLNDIVHSHILAARRKKGEKLSLYTTWILQAMGSDLSGNPTWKQRLVPNALFILSCGHYPLSPKIASAVSLEEVSWTSLLRGPKKNVVFL